MSSELGVFTSEPACVTHAPPPHSRHQPPEHPSPSPPWSVVLCFLVLGLEARSSPMQGKHCTPELQSQPSKLKSIEKPGDEGSIPSTTENPVKPLSGLHPGAAFLFLRQRPCPGAECGWKHEWAETALLVTVIMLWDCDPSQARYKATTMMLTAAGPRLLLGAACWLGPDPVHSVSFS